jgi:hypothetical protein
VILPRLSFRPGQWKAATVANWRSLPIRDRRKLIYRVAFLLACAAGAAVAVGLREASSWVQADPSAADYDPVMLHEQRSEGPDGLGDLHALEPRNPAWAPAMESTLGRVLGSELAARAERSSVLELDCRTLTCSLMLETPSDVASGQGSAAMLALQAPAIADAIVFAPTLRPNAVRVYLAFRPRARSVTAWQAWYRKQHSDLLTRLRSAGVSDRRLYPAGTFP